MLIAFRAFDQREYDSYIAKPPCFLGKSNAYVKYNISYVFNMFMGPFPSNFFRGRR